MGHHSIIFARHESNDMDDQPPDMETLMLAENTEFERVMECVFGIHPHEIRTFFELAERPGSTVGELAETLERDRSNVNRSLSTLQEKGLVERERRLLDGGGYVYQYYAVPFSETKQRMHRAVDEWSEGVHETIEQFG